MEYHSFTVLLQLFFSFSLSPFRIYVKIDIFFWILNNKHCFFASPFQVAGARQPNLQVGTIVYVVERIRYVVIWRGIGEWNVANLHNSIVVIVLIERTSKAT